MALWLQTDYWRINFFINADDIRAINSYKNLAQLILASLSDRRLNSRLRIFAEAVYVWL